MQTEHFDNMTNATQTNSTIRLRRNRQFNSDKIHRLKQKRNLNKMTEKHQFETKLTRDNFNIVKWKNCTVVDNNLIQKQKMENFEHC